MDDPAIKSASTDILSYIVDFNPSMVREYALSQVNKLEDELCVSINLITGYLYFNFSLRSVLVTC